MNVSESSLVHELSITFGYQSFKSELQKQAVTAVAGGTRNVFVSMPTGAGKSLCYQLPALLSSGVALVLSPLIALIENQVAHLKACHVKAETLNSKTTSADRSRILSDLHHKNPSIKLLYITPELVATSHFRSVLDDLYKFKKISLIAVDEAHCVSDWGHDFRPDYLKLGELREAFSSVQWLALTATATPHVQKDIIQSLRMSSRVSVFKDACFRKNLFYEVKFKEILKDPFQDLSKFTAIALGLNITGALSSGVMSHQKKALHSGCGIVYCRTRDGCSMLAGRLSNNGISARAYHAGLPAKERSEIQQQWMQGVVPVIVATISFGMGVDKANVRFVVHWTMPKSMEAYYQESGRAGRDGQMSYCRIYYSKSDRNELVFLLKQEARKVKKRKKKGYTASGHENVSEATQKTFEVLVKYCEEAKCRHATIAEYFSDPNPQCGRSCDFCKDPAATREHTRDGNQLSCSKAAVYASGSYGKPDLSLYGGGRWGHKLDEGGDSSGEEGRGKSLKRGGESLFDSDFFETEFRKRRRRGGNSVGDREEIPDRDCRLREAADLSRIPKLALKVRVHCLDLLTEALEANALLQPGDSSDPAHAAVVMEYSVFTSKKSSQTYKLCINDHVKEIKASTQDKVLHVSLRKCFTCDPTDDTYVNSLCSPSDKPSLTNGPSLTTGFVKASELFSTEQNSRTAIAEFCRTVEPKKASGLSLFVPASSFPMSGAVLRENAHKDSKLPNKEDIHHKGLIKGEVGNVYTNPGGLVKEDSFHGEAIKQEDGICSGGPIKSEEDKKKGECAREMDEIRIKDEKRATDNYHHGDDGNKGMDAQQDISVCTTSLELNNPKAICNVQSVVASKNSLLGFDLHETSPLAHPRMKNKVSLSRKPPSEAIANTSKRKHVADTVVRALNSYYKDKKLSSKDIFKKFAKRLAEHVLVMWDRLKCELGKEIKNILQVYFYKYKQVTAETDLVNLDRLFKDYYNVTACS